MIFFIILAIFLILYFLRLYLSYNYAISHSKSVNKNIDESLITVLQPILSGDIRLESDLRSNLENTSMMKFIWLIDNDDIAAKQICDKILNDNYKNRVKIIEVEPVPPNVNPKVFKLEKAISNVNTEYTIILDDDVVIDMEFFNRINLYLNTKEVLISAIPYNYDNKTFFSKLISAFVNSQSFFTYFTMAYLKQTKTINGMFYMAKTDIFIKYKAFENIKYYLCDDFALASFLRSKNVELIQSTIYCNVRTTVTNLRAYVRLLKRWLLFANVYMSEEISINFVIFALLPNMLPLALIITSLFYGLNYILVAIFTLLIKGFISYIFRYHLLHKKESFNMILFEVLQELTLPIIYFYTLISKPVIIWRNKKIKVSKDKIKYE
jgi:ceramide glucosyltransferase